MKYTGDRIEKGVKNLKTPTWSPEEDQILYTKYPEMGNNCAELLPGRSRAACSVRAGRLGIYKKKGFDDSDDAFLRENFVTLGPEMCAEKLGKSVAMIKKRAAELQVAGTGRRWTEEEDDYLRENFPTMGIRVRWKLAHRTKQSIYSRARRLGLIAQTVRVDGVPKKFAGLKSHD